MGKAVIKSTLEVDPSTVECDPCKNKPAISQSCQCRKLLFLVLVVTELADFLSDWLFYLDISLLQKGLVYGPVGPLKLWLLLFFSVIGSVTFFIEVMNLWWETFRDNAWVDSDILSAVIIWIEDVPQIIINLLIALCHEEPISVFQLVKAMVVILGILVRIVVSAVKYSETKKTQCRSQAVVRAVILGGVLVEAITAVAVFFFTQTEMRGQGAVVFKMPTTYFEETFNDRRYFANVSVFLHHRDLMDRGVFDQDKRDDVVNWIRLAAIEDIRSHGDKEAYFRLQYEGVPPMSDVTKMAVSAWKSRGRGGEWQLSECYTLNSNTGDVNSIFETCKQSGFFTNSTDIHIKFKFEPPGFLFNRKIFGDVRLRIEQKHQGDTTCIPLKSFRDSVAGSIVGHVPMTLRYFRSAAPVEAGKTHVLWEGSQGSRLFRNDGSDLEDIQTVWKTGWLHCDSTGSFGPNWSDNLKMNCSAN